MPPGAARTYPHLRARVFNTPLLVERDKADVILSALADRLGIAPPLAQFDVEEKERAAFFVTEDGIAVIAITGTLVQKSTGMDALSGLTSYAQVAQDLDAALADPKVGGILLDVDSPGGESAGCFELAAKIAGARTQKPIYGVANPKAASGGYALLAAAERIYAPQVSLLGSIGAIWVHADYSKANEQAGVTYTTISSGARKADGDPNAPLSDDARAAIQSRSDATHAIFIESVAKHRGLTPEAVRATEAGVFLGDKAVALGLADVVGDRDAAMAALKAKVQEGRVLKELEQKNQALTQQVAELSVERDTLKVRIATFEAAEAKRKQDGDAAYLEQLKQRAVDVKSPLTADELSAVESLLKTNNRPAAEKLGTAYFELAKARAGKAAETQPLEAPPAGSAVTPAQAEAAILERRGFVVELSEDKTRIVKATKPGTTTTPRKRGR